MSNEKQRIPTLVVVGVSALVIIGGYNLLFDSEEGVISNSKLPEAITQVIKPRDTILTVGCEDGAGVHHKIGPVVFYTGCIGDKYVELTDLDEVRHRCTWGQALHGAGKIIDSFAVKKK